ncbi:MAG: sigma-70 family RNA polymerase sigma factor [Deltaproteobacteria bacterium]|nr:sigma-70 family RNA polymerase sigma factor [Deltaproteobacteria bacterium]
MVSAVMKEGRRPPADPTASADIADEAELVRRCRAGDKPAFDHFYRHFRRLVAANLFRVLGERSELDDLVQEVFVIAFRGMERFRGDARLSTWLYRICVNVALGRLRARARKPMSYVSDPHAQEGGGREPVDSPESPERVLERRDDVALVYRALDMLSPKKRVVLVLHEIEGMDIKEIAEIVRAPLVTVRTRLHYARKEFFRIVSASGGGSTK